jgi:hypothetical protein
MEIQMSRALALGVVMTALSTIVPAAVAQPPNVPPRVGTVQFETSCAVAVRPTFVRGVSLLHSFEYRAAIRSFNEVIAADSTCLIAYWGLAVSAWGNPFAAGIKPDVQLERGLAAVEKGRALTGATERERAYLAAAGRLYDRYQTTDQRTRVIAYRDAMADLAARYPWDDEAVIFHALVLSFAADPNDKTYDAQRKAGATLKRLAARLPDHPGIAHYLIHAYDFPSLASEGLPAADRYAAIAPASSHALHMPSHTYTRVGKWGESIETNIRSAKAASAEGSVAEALHASDYMMYAYLQTGQDSAARRVLDGLASLAERFDPTVVSAGAPPAAGFFAIAAIPARYALERGDWQAAARLDVRESAFPFTDAITWFARGIGAARGSDTTGAAEAVRQLAALRDRLTERREAYWTQQVEIQRRGVAAWLMFARGDRAGAVAEMRATADLEATTDKNAMTPGPIVPAQELLGELLLATGDGSGALRAFEATLVTEPNRFRALAGAMRAAEAAGDAARGRRYAQQLSRVCDRGDRPGRADLVRARGVARSARPPGPT